MESAVGRLLDVPVDWFEIFRLLIELFGLVVTTEEDTATGVRVGLDQRIQSYILAHYADQSFSLRTMAADLHVSAEHLCRDFRKRSGMPPVAYRNHLRAQAARNLLRNTDLPCKAIADKLGYSDHYAFSKAYYRMTGKRPSHERKRGVDDDK